LANESRGDLSEAALTLALESLGFKYGDTVHWRKTPADLRVCDTDVSLGRDRDKPDVIFQVCSSGYEGGYQKKFWRDMGELVEIRRALPKCRVISVLFEPGAKEKLRRIYDFVSDGAIEVLDLDDGARLLDQIARLAAGRVPKDTKAKLAFARDRLTAESIRQLGVKISGVLTRPLASWKLDHDPGSAKVESDLNYRRAVLIGSLFSTARQIERARPFLTAAEKGARLPYADFLEALHQIGVCERALGGSFRVADANLVRSIRRLGVDRFVGIAQRSISSNPSTRLFDYVETIQALPQLLRPWFTAIRRHYDELCSIDGLTEALLRNYEDYGLWLTHTSAKPNEPWIFRRLLDIVRAAEGKHFAIGIPRFDPVFKEAGLPALRFIVSDYVAGRRPLSPEEASVAASVLAKKLQRIRDSVTPQLFDKFQVMVRRSEFQQRLLTYRGFDLFGTMLREQLGSEPQVIVPGIVSGLGIRGAATCEGHLAGDTISMWQGASREGVAHKVKERVGRMGLCCLQVDATDDGRRGFSFRSEWAHRILYVDGAWQRTNIDALLSGCFTEVRFLT
jgi:hypothetical protein